MSDALQELGRDLILGTLGATRTLQTHRADNAAAAASLDRIRALIEEALTKFGELRLQLVDEMILLNGVRVRASVAQAAYQSTFVELMLARGIGGLVFTKAVDLEVLRFWFTVFAGRVDNEESARLLREQLLRATDHGIHLLDLYTLSTQDVHETVRVSSMAFALQVYARALLAFREVVEAVRSDRDPYRNRLGFVRVVQDAIDVATSRPELLFAIIELEKARADRLGCVYAETHAANTCVYAILIGLMLKLDRRSLLDLGTSALLADVGSALLGDDDIAAKKTVLSPAEKERRGALLTRALQSLLGREGNDDSIMLRTIVAFEHRRAIAGDGRPLHLFSRVVAVATAYDAMTTDRPWRRAMTADEALATLLREAAEKLDPIVVTTMATLIRASS